MKNNRLQYVSIAFCVVMLIIIIVQGKKIDKYQMIVQKQVNDQIYSFQTSFSDDIRDLYFYIDNQLEKADNVIASYELTPSGVDKENQCLKADVLIALKEWHDDTAVKLTAKLDEKNVSIDMKGDGTGIYRGQILLPMEKAVSIYLSAQISGGGLTQKEDIGGWGNISMLLPLQSSGGGWSGPEYRDGVMSSQFSISIKGFDGGMLQFREEQGVPISVQNPEFHVYKNGELQQRIPAISSSPEDQLRYAAGADPILSAERVEIRYSVSDDWSIECEIGDVIDIHFVCQDNYGLGYDFFFQSWKVEGETQDEFGAGAFTSGYDGSETLRLFWP